ncbi:MAG TPA: copper amine oxidase N-terminal domain-containing protein [Caldisericia bacterium]|nr:copper amine oxidase N-terminal domain-containing protein [Caldisericia bacterium]HPF49734.1 copper amine oxidase N-terminal domain-containing protein [Caldisericia bacterium]HPI84296.1 copper amine oxidase N-terminal domain-containing protein [Caldisericia bacterium]HPQ93723.1 copper amine oxidase N-terminal domain-containing protein [Caldisericia bacterium]HRV74853.1 copper amine oxidase N-terminal domain-containing protein [Caldisericia bacterium]
MRKRAFFGIILAALMLLSTSGIHNTTLAAGDFNLTAEGGCGFVMLGWDRVPGATHYWIYRGPGPGQEYSTPLIDFPISETEFKDTINIKDGQEYCYFVTALGADASEFAKSVEACATPYCEPEPEPDPFECKLILKYQQGNVNYWVNDEAKGPMETPPVNIQSRLFLVIRYVTQEIPGTGIAWDGAERKVTITTYDGRTIELWIGKKDARVEGTMIQIDPNNPEVVPTISEGRTLMPMRFVAENLGATGPDDIKWYGDTKIVELRFDDPECITEGLTAPVGELVEGTLHRFTVEYHSAKGVIPEVSLLLGRQVEKKEISLSRGIGTLTGEFVAEETGKPETEEIKAEKGKAMKFTWEIKLSPGQLYFYGFEANETKSRLPGKGLYGPLVAPLAGIKRLPELKLPELKVNDEVSVQGFYTHEPYPMLFSEYWKIFERSAPKEGEAVLLKVPPDISIPTGAYITLESKAAKEGPSRLVLKADKISIIKEIQVKKEFEALPVLEDIGFPDFCGCKYGIMFTGHEDTLTVEDSSGTEHHDTRLRADFVADTIRGYKALKYLGICKSQTYVLAGSGNDEIDNIYASDGDGNPFSFNWQDALYREKMENYAQDEWRKDDGWRIRPATRNEFFNVIDEIVADINEHDSCVPELYIFVSDHGGRYAQSSEDDGLMGLIGTSSGYAISDDEFVDQLKKIFATCGVTTVPKIRIEMGICKGGEFIDDVADEYKYSGNDTICMATGSDAATNGWGSWAGGGSTVWGDETGGSFCTPFITSVSFQALWNTDHHVDWKAAYDYAVPRDWAANGFWHDKDDGSTVWVQSYPQYWHSINRVFIMPGVPLPGEPEIIGDPGTIMANPCRLGVDGSELTFDVCNCSKYDIFSQSKKINLKNWSTGTMTIRFGDVDESPLEKCSERSAIYFSKWEVGERADTYLTIELAAGESKDIWVLVQGYSLKKQPVDSNGYMLTDGGMPAYIDIMLPYTYECEIDGSTYERDGEVLSKIRVLGNSHEILYSVSDVRVRSTLSPEVTITNNHKPTVTIDPRPVGRLPENVVAVPKYDGTVNMNFDTLAYVDIGGRTLPYDILKELIITLDAEDINNQLCYGTGESDLEWGSVRIVSRDGTLPNNWELVTSTGKIEKTDPRRVSLKLVVNPNKIEAYYGEHEVSLIFNLVDADCCERWGTPSSTREVRINITVDIQPPR